MPFRIRQRLPYSGGSSAPESLIRTEMDSNGCSKEVLYTSVQDFPSPAMFDLKNLINAKVNLEQVSSKIFPPSGNIPILDPVKKDTTPNESTTTELTTTTKE